MKANKALKRLAKIEMLMSDVTERYSASAPQIREVLQRGQRSLGVPLYDGVFCIGTQLSDVKDRRAYTDNGIGHRPLDSPLLRSRGT